MGSNQTHACQHPLWTKNIGGTSCASIPLAFVALFLHWLNGAERRADTAAYAAVFIPTRTRAWGASRAVAAAQGVAWGWGLGMHRVLGPPLCSSPDLARPMAAPHPQRRRCRVTTT